jgi:hypothetical protein
MTIEARIGDLLTVVAIENCNVRAGRLVGDVADFVHVRRFPSVEISRDRCANFSLRNRPFIVSVSGSKEMKSCVVLLSIKWP